MPIPIPRNDRSRFGIRARLLTLLLPCILGLLALDSWNDYRALANLVQEAYDQSMLQSARTLRAGLSVGADGALFLDARLKEQAETGASGPLHQRLHVALTARDVPGAAPVPRRVFNLLGEADLPTPPKPPASAASNAAPSPLAPGLATDARAIWYDSRYRGQPVRLLALQDQVVDGRGQSFDLLVQAAEDTGPRDRVLAASSQQALLRDARMVLVVIVLVSVGVTWSLRPLEKLRRSVLESEGHALMPLDTSGVPHEVAPLVDTVNQHIASYRDMLEQQSQFLSDASHQLRTPLAIMMTQAGVALREKDPEQLRATLRAIVAQISRSRRLCEQLLSLAHATDGSGAADVPATSDLHAIAKDVVLQYLALAHEKNQDLGWMDARDETHAGTMPASTALPVQARGLELHEVLANLVHNAIVHTPAGGRITVTVGIDAGTAFAEVCDDGPGIPPARRAEVFERFRQVGNDAGDGSATNARGAGLGLAIASAYARRNGGEITLADATGADGGTGLRATLRLPLAS